ncbi:MAG: isoaspartyl peptidase/L-asparaginase [Nitrososphaeria archaeon]
MAFVVHGGAGRARPHGEDLLRVLERASEIGYEHAMRGEVVEAVVEALYFIEESGLFNAGRGSVRNSMGYVEMDAGIMRGSDRAAGAVANLRSGSAIREALRVLQEGKHVLISRPIGSTAPGGESSDGETIGAVAVSKEGEVAAASSTGGIRGKSPGRIGDAAVPGAGFYAVSGTGGTALTGIGEQNMRCLTAYRIVMEMKAEDPLRSISKVFEEVKGEIGELNQGAIAADSRLRMAALTTEEMMPVCFRRSDVRRCGTDFREGILI